MGGGASAPPASPKEQPQETQKTDEAPKEGQEQSQETKPVDETPKLSYALVPSLFFDPAVNQDPEALVLHSGMAAVMLVRIPNFWSTMQAYEDGFGFEEPVDSMTSGLDSLYSQFIEIIMSYRGDVINADGDTLTAYFWPFDDTRSASYEGIVPPHGSYGMPDLGPVATAGLRASACCLEIQKRLELFHPAAVDHKSPASHGARRILYIWRLYSSISFSIDVGNVLLVRLGGGEATKTTVKQWNYLAVGQPISQTKIGIELVDGDICLCPGIWNYVEYCVIGDAIPENPDFQKLFRIDQSKYQLPLVKSTAMQWDERFKSVEATSIPDRLQVASRYTSKDIAERLDTCTRESVAGLNEMKDATIVCCLISGFDEMLSKTDVERLQQIVSPMQEACYAHEGVLTKAVVGSKGCVLSFAVGFHPKDEDNQTHASHALSACLDMIESLKKLGAMCRFGMSSGKTFSGVVGSRTRMEYVITGTRLKSASELMSSAPEFGILSDSSSTDDRFKPSTDEANPKTYIFQSSA